jgi:RNA polymerase sigma-70 factor, ECF subfamily
MLPSIHTSSVMYPVAHARIYSVSRRDSHVDDPEGGASVSVLPVPSKPRNLDVQAEGVGERVGSKKDDETLVRETLAGKRWAQREVWYRFAPMVQGLLRRALSSRYDHDDLAQEVFLRVFRRLHTLENASALRSFVYSVAVRVVSEEIRHFYVLKRARDRLELMSHDTENSGPDFEARETLCLVQEILDGMKDKHRAVFVLRHVEGMDLLEIAAGLDISLATVKRYLVKATVSIHKAVSRDEGLRAKLCGALPAQTLGDGP